MVIAPSHYGESVTVDHIEVSWGLVDVSWILADANETAWRLALFQLERLGYGGVVLTFMKHSSRAKAIAS